MIMNLRLIPKNYKYFQFWSIGALYTIFGSSNSNFITWIRFLLKWNLISESVSASGVWSRNLLFASRPLNSLFMLHINAPSLNKNIFSLDKLIQNFSNPHDIVGVSETWLKSNLERNISIAGYDFIYKNVKKRAGGVAFYISDKFNYDISNNFHINYDDCENLWITLTYSKTNIEYIVWVAYRHPISKHKYFIDALNSFITKLLKRNNTFYLLGDFNINIGKSSHNSSSTMLTNQERRYGRDWGEQSPHSSQRLFL